MESYFPKSNIKKPQRGDLLISEPFLPDPNFERTVVLLCDHNEEGSFGFVLNKVSEIQIPDVLDDTSSLPADLFVGGPVEQNTVHFIHRAPKLVLDATEVAKGIYWGGDFDQVLATAALGQLLLEDFRFFLGYSGWGEGQLEKELTQDSWLIFRGVKPSHVFDVDPVGLWKTVLEEMGGQYKMFANYPVDPKLN